MEEFMLVYKHLYDSLEKLNIPLQIKPDDMSQENIQMLHPIFRLIDAQVERETIDDHVFLFTPLITEKNFFLLKEDNRKILLAYVKKLYKIQEKMDISEPDINDQVKNMLSLFDTTEMNASEEDIEQAANTLGETMGLDENDPMLGIMREIIQKMGEGLKSGKSINDLMRDAMKGFSSRISNDHQSGTITPQQLSEFRDKMMEKIQKLMRNPMMASSMLKSDETKKKEKAERRKALRNKWRNKRK